MRIEQLSSSISIKRDIDQGTEEQRKVVTSIISDVKTRGDQALLDYTQKFDGVTLSNLFVTKEEIEEAYKLVDDEMISIIKEATDNIREYHELQRRESWMMERSDGTRLGQKITSLDAVGLYVPGGTAAYPSSVLMNVIPAQVAGVERIVLVSPPQRETGMLPPAVLVAADMAGVTEMVKVGGAQAIAALAYGTESIPPVDKITGPGNIYVALAKREVFGMVDIDMIAGPSEIVVLADETASAAEVAADLLSQAEHDALSSAVLVTTSKRLAENVAEEVEAQLSTLPREEIARESIEQNGVIYLASSMQEAVQAVNSLAPEHLEIMTDDAESIAEGIRHAGAIFIGRYSSEPVGDYFVGTNHVLPTNGTARFSSPLSVDDFIKKSSIIIYSKEAMEQNAAKIASFAREEKLEAHARAVEIRLKGE
ncbi:histidinol dehydrogenase [Mangrovibacillus cuniculi]|uniref:Histidinol dehydrogenase n=1 Tax=Mangrovibacillus cuniculi TaxID=2593652 RepID=A0A7S8CCJ3_9BACI|nr:histidinol dehydrogenase [Mangrovibacillus cuniculi]QPC47463.1 histidinol dehydrogenase [Mangrovibacillus cuniculi]